MTQREINKMTVEERWAELRKAAGRLDKAMNLFGTDDEPINGLLDADASEGEIERRLDKIMEPECSCRKGSCDHAFPAWFCREQQPVANEYMRLYRQCRKAGL